MLEKMRHKYLYSWFVCIRRESNDLPSNYYNSLQKSDSEKERNIEN